LLVGVRAGGARELAEGLAAALRALLAGDGGAGGVEADEALVAGVGEFAGVVGGAHFAGGVEDADEFVAGRDAEVVARAVLKQRVAVREGRG
jgi:hypothetical protein